MNLLTNIYITFIYIQSTIYGYLLILNQFIQLLEYIHTKIITIMA